jgi:hypothetical protein
MQIYIKTVSDKILLLDVESTDTHDSLRQKIIDISADFIDTSCHYKGLERFCYTGILIAKNMIIGDYNIPPLGTIHLIYTRST